MQPALLRLNYIALALLFAGSVLAWPALPGRIPIHFGLSGAPDVWVARTWLSWLLLPLLAAGVFALVYGIGVRSARRPHLWNLPEKARFLKMSAAEQAPIIALLLRYLSGVTLTMISFLGLTQLCIFLVATGYTHRLPWFFSAGLVLTMGGIVISALRLRGRIRERVLSTSRSPGTMR
ncbi:MAG: DUF1648 domain-containing protein [Longimicrobiales bacterium]